MSQEYNTHIFDGIFKLDYERCSRLFIPVVNEIFGLNISENAFDNFNGNRQVLLELPKSAVIFVRDFPTEDYGSISYGYSGKNELTYNVPFLKLSRYEINELEQSKLYVLYPLYIAKYEEELKALSYNSEESEILAVENTLTV